MSEYKKEITGEKLNRFMARYNKASEPQKYYDTEEALCCKYGLDKDQLYVFMQRTGRLNDDGSHKDKNFIPNKDGLEFGPLVNANGTLNYYNPYWIMPFTDVKHKSNLQDCIRNSKIVAKNISNVIVNPKRNASPTLEYRIDFLNAVYREVDGELGLIDQSNTSKIKKIIRNPSGKTDYNGTSYDMAKLLKALRYNEDYVKNSLLDPRDVLGGVQTIKPEKKVNPVVESVPVKDLLWNIDMSEFECYAFVGFRQDGTSVSEHIIKNAKDKSALIGLMPTI